MNRIIGTDDKDYLALYNNLPDNAKHNGLYYYAKTLEKDVAPFLNTDRLINLIGLKACGGEDRMILFVHNNLTPEKDYAWSKCYDDVIYVSNTKRSYEYMKNYGHSLYLTPCVNVKEVKKFGRGVKKDQEACFAGNPWPAYRDEIDKYVPAWVHRFGTMPREELLPIIAHYKKVYAMGCTAVEARALGCKIMKRSEEYDPEDFPLLDVKDAIRILQNKIDEVEENNRKRCSWWYT